MFLLNVDYGNACRFRVFHSRVFSLPMQCWNARTDYWKVPAFLSNIQNVVPNSSCWQCLCTLLFRYFQIT